MLLSPQLFCVVTARAIYKTEPHINNKVYNQKHKRGVIFRIKMEDNTKYRKTDNEIMHAMWPQTSSHNFKTKIKQKGNTRP